MTEVKKLMVVHKDEYWKRQRQGRKRKLGAELERGRENVLTEVSRNGEGKFGLKRDNIYG